MVRISTLTTAPHSCYHREAMSSERVSSVSLNNMAMPRSAASGPS